MVQKTKKIGNNDTLEKILKDYKKILNGLKDKQDQLYIEGKLKDQIEED